MPRWAGHTIVRTRIRNKTACFQGIHGPAVTTMAVERLGQLRCGVLPRGNVWRFGNATEIRTSRQNSHFAARGAESWLLSRSLTAEFRYDLAARIGERFPGTLFAS